MVWRAISQAGVSRAYVGHVRGQSVHTIVYIQSYLAKLRDSLNLHHVMMTLCFGLTKLCATMITQQHSDWKQYTICASSR